MKYTTILLLFFTVIFSYTCNQSKQSKTLDEANSQEVNFDTEKGFELVESYCFTCHSPNASMDNRIAPPMIAIKKHYINDETTEEGFVQDIVDFVNNPSEEKSKMPGAVKKFNLMPKMSFSEEDITLIAQYIYHAELEKPEWFEEHYKQEKGKYFRSGQSNEDKSYKALGKEYALKTKSILGKNLLGAINEKGTAGAVAFCNTEAIHLTDSMATELGVKIKRVSDLERNPNNKANEQELAYIKQAKEKIALGDEITPKVIEDTDKVLGYYPIMTNAMCLQCHGKTNDINEETLAKLNTLYPNDKARGYAADELRGIWVIEMNK